MGHTNEFNYIYTTVIHHQNGSHQGSYETLAPKNIDGWYSEWNGGWTSLACISGKISATSDVLGTLAYTTGTMGTASYKDIQYTNGGINGTGAKGNTRFTITLDNNQRQQVNQWLKTNSTGLFSLMITSSLLPSYLNGQNMIVFNLGATEQTKIFIGLRGYYHNSKFTAQESNNGCLRYGRSDLPARYMYINATYSPHAKNNGAAYLYDFNTNLYPVAYKYTESFTYDYINNAKTICNNNSIPINFTDSRISSSFPQPCTTTYRVIQYDANSGSVIIENAVSPYYAAGIDIGYPLQTPIIICCNETYYTTKVIKLVSDNCTITKHTYNYHFDPNLIPVTGNSGLTNKNNNVYGYGHVFYSVNYPYCIWLSDTTESQQLNISRTGNQVRISFGNYETVMTYNPIINIAILSNDPNGVCYYTINQITQGFDKHIDIYPFNPVTPLVNTSALHNALVESLKTKTDQRWTINTSTSTISGVFNTKVSNDTWCITLMDISVNYQTYTYDSVNISIDVIPLNQSTNQYVVKTAISTSEFVDNISSTISVTWQNNGVNILLPCSARTYSLGSYLGVEALSVNQNTFGLALQYLEKDTTPDITIAPFFDPFIEHYFGSKDTIQEGDENDLLYK